MYEFVETTPPKNDHDIRLPAEALLINGVAIETLIAGYRTVSVDGRELALADITSVDVPNREGRLFQYAKFPDRQFKITYLLKADTERDFREMYDKLNSLLTQRQFRASFWDQPEFYFTVTMTSASVPDAGMNDALSDFTLTASDPYKHRVQPVSNTGVGSVEIVEPLYYPVVPEEIHVRLTKTVKDLNITNGRQTIKLTGEIPAGEVVIKPDGGDDYLTINGTYRPELFDWLSDLENFEVKTGDVVTVDTDAKITVLIRSKRL